MRKLWLNAGFAAALIFVTVVTFAAYLKPGMLVEFANLVLCN